MKALLLLLLLGALMVRAQAGPTAPSEFYIAIRTDGDTGEGTADDPYDGSTPERFDAFFTSHANLTYVTVHLAKGTYVSRGITLRQGWTFQGAGTGQTIIRLAPNAAGTGRATILVNSSPHLDQDIEEMTLDGNIENQAQMWSGGAVGSGTLNPGRADIDIMGIACGGTVRRVNLVNFGSPHAVQRNECFWIYDLTESPTTRSYNVVIDQCVATAGNFPSYDSFFVAGSGNGDRDALKGANGNVYITHNSIVCASDQGTHANTVGYSCGGLNSFVEDNFTNGIYTGVYMDTGNSRNFTVRNNVFRRCVDGVLVNGGYANSHHDQFVVEDNEIDLMPDTSATPVSAGVRIFKANLSNAQFLRNRILLEETARIPSLAMLRRSRSGNVATIVTASPHGYSAGQFVYIYNATEAGFNSSHPVQITRTGANSFTYSNPGKDLAVAADPHGVILPVPNNQGFLLAGQSGGINNQQLPTCQIRDNCIDLPNLANRICTNASPGGQSGSNNFLDESVSFENNYDSYGDYVIGQSFAHASAWIGPESVDQWIRLFAKSNGSFSGTVALASAPLDGSGIVTLRGGAATVPLPGYRFDDIIHLRRLAPGSGVVGGLAISSDKMGTGFSISSTSPDDDSVVGWSVERNYLFHDGDVHVDDAPGQGGTLTQMSGQGDPNGQASLHAVRLVDDANGGAIDCLATGPCAVHYDLYSTPENSNVYNLSEVGVPQLPAPRDAVVLNLLAGPGAAFNSTGGITASGPFDPAGAPVTVAGSLAGSASFCEPFQGAAYKKVVINLVGLNGTASYNFPVAFANLPVVVNKDAAVSSLTGTGVTVSGAGTTRTVILEGN